MTSIVDFVLVNVRASEFWLFGSFRQFGGESEEVVVVVKVEISE